MMDQLIFGAAQTFLLFFYAWLIGAPLGAALALMAFRSQLVRSLLHVMATAWMVVPLLAVLFWFHYPLQLLFAVVLPPFLTATVVLSLFVAFTAGDIFSDSLLKTSARFDEAAAVLGIRWFTYISEIVLPGAAFLAAPRLLSLAIFVVHATMFTSLIGVEELFRVVQRLNAEFLRPVELFTAMAAVYALLCLPIYVLAMRLQYRVAIEFDND
jgi:polar amino acid transport system permease protein